MSLQIGAVPEACEYLVIGSGFGGSVMAATLAETKGDKVCLLERGKAFPPGSFPRTPDGVAANFWDPSKGLHGMFNVWSFDHIDAIVSSGLGGGSLIYANVMLEKEPEWFTQPKPGGDGDEEWSFTYDDLYEHYCAVAKFLHVETMPAEFAAQASPKTQRFLDASEGKGRFAPLAVRFTDANGLAAIGAPLPEEPYGSIFGAPRRTTCRMIGECDIGCNEGAKSSMDHTYLSKAHADGASIHIRTEVRKIHLRPQPDPYLFDVYYVVHTEAAEGRHTKTSRLEVKSIKAKRVVLAAGALGSTFLMLDNAERLGIDSSASAPLGARFCGNGDLLGIANPKNRDDRSFEPTRGPVITAYRKFESNEDSSHETARDKVDGREPAPADIRMYLQDGGVPAFATWVIKLLDAPGILGRLFSEALWFACKAIANTWDNDVSGEISRIMGGSPRIARGLPLLGMGRDVPDGRMTLHRGNRAKLECDWRMNESWPHFIELRRQMQRLTERFGTNLTITPIERVKRVITVHPLGGCPADTNRFYGVVDGYGRVHGVPGLWITDGSVMPGPVGANPSLTIAAFAHRAAKALLEEGLDSATTSGREADTS